MLQRSVLDYVKDLIGSKADEQQIDLAKSLYRFNREADGYSEADDASIAVTADYVIGDADGSGEVTIMDATAIQRKLADFEINLFCEEGADVDGKGLDILDATRIQRFIADFDDDYQIGVDVPGVQPASDEYLMNQDTE